VSVLRLGIRSAVATLCALGIVASLAACGEESSPARATDEASIRTLAERFESILASRDVKAFCRVLAPNDRQRLGGGRTDGKAECLTVWAPERNPLFQANQSDLGIESISFSGAYATAKLANGGELAFANENGRWYIHLEPAPSQTQGAGS
jgi:hypothetical protein